MTDKYTVTFTADAPLTTREVANRVRAAFGTTDLPTPTADLAVVNKGVSLRVKTLKGRTARAPQVSPIRQFAIDQGLKIGKRGVISNEIKEAYAKSLKPAKTRKSK